LQSLPIATPAHTTPKSQTRHGCHGNRHVMRVVTGRTARMVMRVSPATGRPEG
jgi:hypothetical protein